MTIRISTRRLCEITGTSHGRLNFLIATGLFPWAPPANGNHTRTWDAGDILTVMIYQQLVNERATVNRAAKIANTVGAAARVHPECGLVAYAEFTDASPRAIALASLMDAALWNMDDDLKRLTIFNVAQQRQLIEHEMKASLQDSEAA